MHEQCLSAHYRSISSPSIVEDVSFVTLYHLGEGDGLHPALQGFRRLSCQVELGRLDSDTVRGFDRKE